MIRKNFFTDQYVFYAEERANRPHSFKRVSIHNTPKKYCPFCVENEYMTPKKIYGDDDNLIRIVPNKYPYLTPGGDDFGIHDVVIDTPEHEERLSMFSVEHIERLLKVLRNRMRELEADERIKLVQIFKNQGMDAGASQSHSHWQITALPVVPDKYANIMKKMYEYKKENGECYFCAMKKKEGMDKLIIEENEDMEAICPYDALFSYEINILPKRHIHSFDELGDKEISSLAVILKHSLMRLCRVYDGICYNICFYSSVKDDENKDSMHFFIQIIPRIGHMAGFEFSTGCFISSMPPEKAAVNLRNIDVCE